MRVLCLWLAKANYITRRKLADANRKEMLFMDSVELIRTIVALAGLAALEYGCIHLKKKLRTMI